MRHEDIQKTIKCRWCMYSNQPPDFQRMPEDHTHYGRIECHQCHRHLDWVGKPESAFAKTKRPSPHRKLVRKKQAEVRYCELCLRMECSLPPNQKLHGHHTLEYQMEGDATPINTLVVCTECHTLIHWRRNYSIGEKLHENETTFIAAIGEQRAAAIAGAASLGALEDYPKAKRADQGSIPGERGNGKQHGPKHLGDFLRRDDQSPPF